MNLTATQPTHPSSPSPAVELKIIFNGQEYSSPDAMPPDVRQQYDRLLKQLPDTDRNGLPDILERPAGNPSLGMIGQTTILVNGRHYGSVNEMPAVVRELYQRVMAGLDADGDNVPDVMQQSTPPVQSRLSPPASSPEVRGPSSGLLLLAFVVGFLALFLWLWARR